MPCCNEPDCTRQYPVGLYRGDLSGVVYAVTKMRLVKDRGDGTGTWAAQIRHDVTPQMERFIRENREWVREVLSEENGATDA